MSDNVYFMESELCMGTMNDKCVDKLHKKREPKHWNAKHSTTQSVVVARKGVRHRRLAPQTSRQGPRQFTPLLTRLGLALDR
tara:strand:- start:59 stop:304 length:246 start_codon:yes stop_codon:yes gene_type:complete